MADRRRGDIFQATPLGASCSVSAKAGEAHLALSSPILLALG
jgi:hypothetical protein